MSDKSHQQYLERNALRAAQKAIDRKGRDGFTKNDFAHLRIQTVEPWKRIILFIPGALSLVAGVFMVLEKNWWAGILLGGIGAVIIFIAILGKKKTIETALDGIDVFTILGGLLDV